jgi:phage terminase small subunit
LKATLNAKQKRFCDEYLVDHNATRAAIAAGYSPTKPNVAQVRAAKLMKLPYIKKYIAERERKITKKLEISAERTKMELARIAFQDARQFFNQDGSLTPVHLLDDDAAACLAGVEIEELFEYSRAGKEQIGVLKKIKRYDKIQALNMLAKHFKLFEEAPAQPVTINFGSLSVQDLKTLLAMKKKAAV